MQSVCTMRIICCAKAIVLGTVSVCGWVGACMYAFLQGTVCVRMGA